jgi:hypothetical protein
MAKQEWEIERERDADLIARMKRLSVASGNPNGLVYHYQLGSGYNQLQVPFDQVESDPTLKKVLAFDAALIWKSVLQFPQLGCALSVERPPTSSMDTLIFDFPNHMEAGAAAKIIGEVYTHYPRYSRMDAAEKYLGKEVSEFFRAREISLTKLETIARDVVENTEKYRAVLDLKYDEKIAQLDLALSRRREELDTEFNSKHGSLDELRTKLDERTKNLDDRESKHARRALREVLQNSLKELGKDFSLTRGTTTKRRSIHVLFVLLSGLVVGHAVGTVWESWGLLKDWIYGIRLSLSAASLIAIFYVYIRWSDAWFRQHADEEFRLKRLALDLDRASWVVETAMEWQQQNKAAIPGQLLEQLSKGLFAAGGSTSSVRHPIEDVASAAFSTASSLKVKLPGGSEATFDRKGVERLSEAIDKAE